MNRNVAALAALAAGILAGALVRASGVSTLIDFAHGLQPIGVLWLNALRMTLVPLIFGMVAKGMIALDRTGGGGRLLGVTLPLILSLLVLAMALGFVFGLAFEAIWSAAQGALAPWSTASAEHAAATPSITGMIVDLLPSNPVAAAAQGNLVAIVVFAIIFGFAVSRTSIDGNGTMASLIDALSDAMIRIVHWVLIFTPAGIFILSLGLALDAGISVAGFMAELVIASCAAATLAIVIS
jgi:proton glutamate symport protein